MSMNENDFGKRRCYHCRKFFPKCDLYNHSIYGLICKQCYDNYDKKIKE